MKILTDGYQTPDLSIGTDVSLGENLDWWVDRETPWRYVGLRGITRIFFGLKGDANIVREVGILKLDQNRDSIVGPNGYSFLDCPAGKRDLAIYRGERRLEE